jgi:PAS domain-containing protein
MNAQDVHERKIFNAAPDGILVVDCHGNIVRANPAIETITGYSAAHPGLQQLSADARHAVVSSLVVNASRIFATKVALACWRLQTGRPCQP